MLHLSMVVQAALMARSSKMLISGPASMPAIEHSGLHCGQDCRGCDGGCRIGYDCHTNFDLAFRKGLICQFTQPLPDHEAALIQAEPVSRNPISSWASPA